VEIEFGRFGELLWLDFANTIRKRRNIEVDLLRDFHSLLQFLLEFGVITPAIQGTLQKAWGWAEQSRALVVAHSFRQTLRKLAIDLSRNHGIEFLPSELNEMLSFQSGYSSIVKTVTGYELRQQRDITAPEHLLVPIAESVAWLLCTGDWKLVRICNNPECGLFFYDTTKNHSRRWCSMLVCGNRSKVHAYLRRKDQSETRS
jgi:predicted RNA-binding Zn ribbon-like protein